MYEWSAAPYANGLMAPWVAQSAPVTQQLVQEQVAPAMGVQDGGTGRGFSSLGNTSTAAGTSQATQGRVKDSLRGSLGVLGGKAALGALGGLALGMPTGMMGSAIAGSLASPSTIGGVLGNSLNAALGTTPSGFLGRAVGNFAVPTIAGMALGPVGGLGGGLLGGVVADGLGDAFDGRTDEEHKDAMEDAHGYFGGRVAAADINDLARAGGFTSLGQMASAYGYGPTDLAKGMTNRDATKARDGRNPSGSTYGGFGSIGGPSGGARAVDSAYGREMGGFAGLGIGNPSSYGGSNGGGSRGGSNSSGGYGGHAGDKDGSSTGFGR